MPQKTKFRNSPKKFKNIKKRPKNIKQKGVKFSYVDKAVLNTLSYAAVFNYPLSFYQVSHFLLNKKKINIKDIGESLLRLQKNKKVRFKKGKYYLEGTNPVHWEKKAEFSEVHLKKAREIAKILSKIPWIQFIGVTGSVAAFNAREDDDIDFFIVSKKDRLWITRGFVFVILVILGELHKAGICDNKICPNIFVDDSRLKWRKTQRNMYVAREVLMVYPLIDRENTYFRFLSANDWAFEFFGNIDWEFSPTLNVKEPQNFVLKWLEKMARQLQLKYMNKKRTSEITKRDLIHFNKKDSTDFVLDKYNEIKDGIMKNARVV